jgi:hypothetical protein
MMNTNSATREYVGRALDRLGSVCPIRYAGMLVQTPANAVIENLSPWAFLPDPERSAKYCSEALGRPVLPFAQAVEQDMVACFLPEPAGNPAVVVINPWSENKAAVVKTLLPNYEAWLKYAAEVSSRVQAREAEDDENS